MEESEEKKSKPETIHSFFTRHHKLKILLFSCLIIGVIVLGFNVFSFLRHWVSLKTDAHPEKYDVISSELLIEGGGRLVWSPDGNALFYDSVDAEAGIVRNHEVYNLYRYDFATGNSDKLIDTQDPVAPSGNKGQPTISSDGTWLLFQGEYEEHDINRIWCHPGKGKHNNLWVMNINTEEIFQLTDLGINEGVLHPQFDPSGTKICYSHLYSSEGWTGSWQIRVADFIVENGKPKLTNTTSYKPGASEGENTIFYETHDFSKDGNKILFTSDVDTGAMGLSEIYTFDLITEELVKLTQSWECHDEHANYSPDHQKIIWISKMQQQWVLYRTDLFIMDEDGSNKQMLVKSPGGIIADNDWSPDGTKIAFTNLHADDMIHEIYLVTLKGS